MDETPKFGRYLRVVAIVVNTVAAVAAFVAACQQGQGHREAWKDALSLLAISLMLAANVVAILHPHEPVTWLGLWMQRRTIEERRKLADAKRGAATDPSPPAA